MAPAEELIDELRYRLGRYRADRDPVQHASAQFQLGVALADAGRPEEAVEALTAAASLLQGPMPVEAARTLNALGAALRMAGRGEEAIEAFRAAAAAFAEADLPTEHGAALFNLGLVHRERADDVHLERAVDCFQRAEQLLRATGQHGHAGASARERGSALLGAGRLEEASAALADALALAGQADDRAGEGTVTNLLGLVHLAGGRLPEAIASFRAAAACHPRSIRPEGYAMAKANLALGYERAGSTIRARIAARQALAAPRADHPVSAQAAAVLDRLGNPAGDLAAVLADEPVDGWPGVAREEVVRWAATDSVDRRREVAAWIDAQLHNERGVTLCEVWLGALLELPPADMETLIRTALSTYLELESSDRDSFRAQLSAAMARFHVPQLMRLRETFNRLGNEVGVDDHFG